MKLRIIVMIGKHKNYYHSLADITSSKWALLIIDVLGSDTLRFTQLQARTPHISQKVLTETLRRLERSGIVHRIIHPSMPPRVEYSLTHLGLELAELANVMHSWAEKNKKSINAAQDAYDLKY